MVSNFLRSYALKLSSRSKMTFIRAVGREKGTKHPHSDHSGDRSVHDRHATGSVQVRVVAPAAAEGVQARDSSSDSSHQPGDA